jgi:hypothetical protein
MPTFSYLHPLYLRSKYDLALPHQILERQRALTEVSIQGHSSVLKTEHHNFVKSLGGLLL